MNNKLYLILFILVLAIIIFFIYKNNIESFESNKINNKKIAFCFLIYDSINHEKLWYEFFRNINKDKYNIYIHYKENKPLEYFEEYKINEEDIIETEWCKNSLVKAQIKLYEYAMRDKENYKMIMVSNSCIPLKNFDYIYNFLTKDNYGYYNEMPFGFFIRKYLEYSFYNNFSNINKASQWSIINRQIAYTFINSKNINKLKRTNLICPDEIFFISEIKTNNLENQIKINTNEYDSSTYVNWSLFKNYENTEITLYKKPHEFIKIDERQLNVLINSNCLFGRKFLKNCIGIENLIEKINIPKNKLEFIHIPKNGGTSIENLGYIHNIYWGKNNKNYMIKENINCSKWHNHTFLYKKDNFAITRNPYDRIISEFYFNSIGYTKNITNFKLWVKDIFENYKINKYVNDSHIIPQSEYIYDENENKRIEHIIKIENNFEDNLNKLFNLYNLNIDITKLEKNNSTLKIFNKFDLDQDTLDSIYNFYKKDFKLFGYNKID
jgi:hypothetical protein